MRTTVTLDDDVAAAIEAERAARGETFRVALNRLVRRGLRGDTRDDVPPLPSLRGVLRRDIADVSVVLGELDDEERRPGSAP